MSLNVAVRNGQQRKRLQTSLALAEEQIVRLRAGTDAVKANPGWQVHREAIIKSAESNVRDLKKALAKFDAKAKARKGTKAVSLDKPRAARRTAKVDRDRLD